jgi:hypothetical protein
MSESGSHFQPPALRLSTNLLTLRNKLKNEQVARVQQAAN